MSDKIHLGIIPDGNRRYCRKQGINVEDLIDHWFNNMILKNVKKIVDSDFKLIKDFQEINEISLYISSIDNINRDDGSTELGYKLIRRVYEVYKNKARFFTLEQCKKIDDSEFDVKLNVVGDHNLIPKDIKKIINEFKQSGKDNSFVITLAMAYDYKKDLTNYGNNENSNYNREQSQIDCIFRSGNEFRTSGFFPSHILYSEIVISEKLWPEIVVQDIKDTIKIFNVRKRRFGK